MRFELNCCKYLEAFKCSSWYHSNELKGFQTLSSLGSSTCQKIVANTLLCTMEWLFWDLQHLRQLTFKNIQKSAFCFVLKVVDSLNIKDNHFIVNEKVCTIIVSVFKLSNLQNVSKTMWSVLQKCQLEQFDASNGLKVLSSNLTCSKLLAVLAT